MLLRMNLIMPLACVVLLRQSLCSSCVGADDEPCQYEVTPIEPGAETLWGTTAAEDIAELEIPQHGVWRWGETEEFIELDESGVELPAWATFVHDPDSIRFSEHVDGGHRVACHGPTVSVDGTLTFTDEQGGVIVSVPLTVAREYQAEAAYQSSPQYSPISLFSDRVHATEQWEMSQVFGALIWLPEGLSAEFYYQAQSMNPEPTENGTVTGDGVISLVGEFVADGPP